MPLAVADDVKTTNLDKCYFQAAKLLCPAAFMVSAKQLIGRKAILFSPEHAHWLIIGHASQNQVQAQVQQRSGEGSHLHGSPRFS
jgi:hypothetical protein